MNILIPDSWLREYLQTDATPDDIKRCLSLCGPSIEKINKVGKDYVYEIEITTNRIDMVSVYGISREAAAILPRFGLKASLKKLNLETPPKPQTILPMEVSDPQKICNRIMGIVLEVEPMKDSPAYIKDRLEKSGIRALNNLVDVTNYVMLELGHPSHVFDYNRIKTHTFLIRNARKNEPIITLDNKKYLLSPDDVIIDDGTGRVIDLPGIMGTQNSVVINKTRRIFFFIESNNPILIRRTSMRYGIRTMAASINEKHPDPKLVKTAFFRGIELFRELAGAQVAGEIIDIYPNIAKPKEIKVSVEFINGRLGIKLEKEEIIKILESLGFNSQLTANNSQLIITPPAFRQFDVIIPEDVVEEVARIYGYHNLPASLMTGEIPIPEKSKIFNLEKKIKTMLKYSGFTEIYNYSFISKDLIEKSLLKTSDHLKVSNPLTPEIEYMRISLIPSMLDTVFKNQPYKDNLQLFELANVYQKKTNSLPYEFPMLAISSQYGFFELKGLIEAILSELGIIDYQINPGADKEAAWPHFWNTKQTLSVVKNNKAIAIVGKIHSQISQNFQIKNTPYIAVLNIELISQMASSAKKYIPIPLYPPVIEDLSLLIPGQTPIAKVIELIYKTEKLVNDITIIDRFENKTTVRITYRSEDRNLESAEVKKAREKILSVLKEKLDVIIKEK